MMSTKQAFVLGIVIYVIAGAFIIGCGQPAAPNPTPRPEIIEVVKEVEVPVEVIREVEVPVEVVKEVEVPVEVIREVEVPVEIIREVEVPVEVIKEVVVIKEVPVEVFVKSPTATPVPTATPKPGPTIYKVAARQLIGEFLTNPVASYASYDQPNVIIEMRLVVEGTEQVYEVWEAIGDNYFYFVLTRGTRSIYEGEPEKFLYFRFADGQDLSNLDTEKAFLATCSFQEFHQDEWRRNDELDWRPANLYLNNCQL